MDQHDHDEDDLLSISTPCEDPAMNQDQFYEPNPARIKKWNSIENIPDIELTPPPLDEMIQISPAIEDPYDGASLLWFSHGKIPIHPELRKPTRIK